MSLSLYLLPLIFLLTLKVFAIPAPLPNYHEDLHLNNNNVDNTNFTLRVIHTNDVHSRLDEFNAYGLDCTPHDKETNNCYGGYARIQSLVKKLRSETPHPSVLFDAGDQFQGTLFFSYYKGSKIAQLMNTVGYDLMTIGNHEFDTGLDVLSEFIQSLKFPVVSSNINASTQPEFNKLFKPYTIFEDINVAVIGYITPTTGGISLGTDGLEFQDPIPVVQSYVDELLAKGINRIICVSHNGYEEDKALASRTHGIDLIVGGHSHTLLLPDPSAHKNAKGVYPTPVENLDKETTWIVQAQNWGKYVGNLDVTWNAQGQVIQVSGEPILVDMSIPQDPEMEAWITEWRQPFQKLKETVVATALDNFELTPCLWNECALGSLLVDSIYDYRFDESTMISKTDISLINGAGIRSGLEEGIIDMGAVMTVLPFGNSLVDIEVIGREILNVLESVARKRNAWTGNRVLSISHWSGLKFQYSESTGQVRGVIIRDRDMRNGEQWSPLDLEKTYTVTTVDFIAMGGDGFLVPRPYSQLTTDIPIDSCFRKYLEKLGRIVPYGNQGRIVPF